MSTNCLDVPVVLLVFNRPELTARVFECIRRARPPKLFVVADGPRANRPGDLEECRHVRDLIENGVDWPCEVVRDYSDTNLGSALRVSTGLTRALLEVERVIVLEDDCIPDPSFFPFCTELLERYHDDEQIAQIAGCSFRISPPANRESYYFSRHMHCWGWATWRRAWRHYDHTMTAWTNPRRRTEILRCIESQAERRYWRHAFDGTQSGRHDSWAYRWTLSCWAQQALSIVSAVNLVSNIGFGPEATHTRESGELTALPLQPMEFPLIHPLAVVRDRDADLATGLRCFRRPSLLTRFARRLRRIFA